LLAIWAAVAAQLPAFRIADSPKFTPVQVAVLTAIAVGGLVVVVIKMRRFVFSS